MGRMEEGEASNEGNLRRSRVQLIRSLPGSGCCDRSQPCSQGSKGEREEAATLSAFGLEDGGGGVRVSGGETEH